MFALWLSLSCLLPPACGSPPSGASSAVCGPDSCYTAHLRRRSFTQAWRACRETGGNLASVRRRAEAALVEELVRGLEPPGGGKALKLWLGLQRQPRQCAPRKPLRGFTWTTGDQDTRFTNWLRGGAGDGEDGAVSCPAARCVALTYGAGDATDFKWVEGSCRLSVEGYLCRYTFRGMCSPLEADAPVSYAAPFGLTTSSLRWVPFGSVGTVRCAPPGAPVSVLCKAREGGVGWSRDFPYCRGPGAEKGGGCAAESGCRQLCAESGESHRCGCRAGFELAPDGRSCRDVDECALGQCPQLCANTPGSYTCLCAPGYRLDGGECRDVDECALGQCSQLCANTPGSYTCLCAPGYRLDGGECRDVDECALGQCSQLCANTPGSYRCYCRVGYRLERDEGGAAHCQDVDECQFQGSCQQMCVNYLGHFECHCREGFVLETDGFSCMPEPGRPSLPSFPSGTAGGLGLWREGEGDGWPGAAGETWPPTARRTETAGLASPLPTEQPAGAGRSPAVPTGGPAEVGPLPDQSSGEPGETGAPPLQSTGQPEATSLNTFTPTGQPPESGQFSLKSAGHGQHLPKSTGQSKESSISTGQPGVHGQHVPDSVEQSPREEAELERPLLQSTAHSGEFAVYSPARATEASLRAGPLLTQSSARPAEQPGPDREEDRRARAGPTAASRGQSSRDDRWLLVALLAPVCVLGTVALALGIAYCTRSACGQARSVAGCYRWIHGSPKVPDPITGSADLNSAVSVADPQGAAPAGAAWHTDVSSL